MRLVIVEDHVMFREVMRKVCIQDFGFDVVGEASTLAEAKQVVQEMRPDVILLDLNLPDGDGFDIVDFAFEADPKVRVLVLSSHCDNYTLFRVEQSGVQGFVDKNSQTTETLRKALELVGRGQGFYSEAFQEAKLARRHDPSSFTKILSDKECEIVSMIGLSFSDEEISIQLGISASTVQSHRSHIMRKLGISGTPKLIQFALQHGFARVNGLRAGRPVSP